MRAVVPWLLILATGCRATELPPGFFDTGTFEDPDAVVRDSGSGDTSETGETGETGDTSETGETGETGDTSDSGDTGEPGETDETDDTDLPPLDIDVRIDPDAPRTTDGLRAIVSGAPAGASVDLTWSRDSQPTPWTAADIPASETARGERWTVDVLVSLPPRTASARDSVVIEDTPPDVTRPRVAPPDPSLCTPSLTCEDAVGVDADGDAVSLVITWTIDGAPLAGVEGAVLTPGAGNAPRLGVGDVVACLATPVAAGAPGVAVASAQVTVALAPVDEDGDQDGLCDGEDPCIGAAGSPDADGDGLCADTEAALGTRDDAPDSDGDGLSDFDEFVVFGTDPANPDTDGGGTGDGDEVALGTEPRETPADDQPTSRVFVTDLVYTVGALWGAGDTARGVTDRACANAASDAGLPGMFHAAAAFPGLDVTERLPDAMFIRPDLAVVGDRADLLAGTLAVPIDRTASSAPVPPGARTWTWAQADGTRSPANQTCDLGGPAPEGVPVALGEPARVDTRWLFAATAGCGEAHRLVCVQVDDTDRDGLSDADELARGTRVDLADTDGDGVLDGDEVAIHVTDPRRTDTDGGGLSDGVELRLGYDPTLAADDPPVWRVFTTRGRYDARHGGLFGADARCAGEAAASRLGGSWRAILSTEGVDAAARLDAGVYLGVDGTFLDVGPAGLLDGSLEGGPVRLDASAGPITGDRAVWTSTFADGTAAGDGACTDWSAGAGAGVVGVGLADAADGAWLDGDDRVCADLARLYCVAFTDSDGDGLSDAAEVALGTTILNPDTDGDGVEDGVEVYVTFTDPLVADVDTDP